MCRLEPLNEHGEVVDKLGAGFITEIRNFAEPRGEDARDAVEMQRFSPPDPQTKCCCCTSSSTSSVSGVSITTSTSWLPGGVV